MAAQTKKKINMSKRYGHLIERIIERSNMDRAFDEVVDQLPEAKIVYYRTHGENTTVKGEKTL